MFNTSTFPIEMYFIKLNIFFSQRDGVFWNETLKNKSMRIFIMYVSVQILRK